jgi:hypothetical protein
LRDPSFVDSIPSKSKDLYAAENYLAKCKMSDLRENIKASELKWRSYRYIDNFAKMVKEDLVANIAEQFRGEKLPTTYELEEMKHSSFAIAYADGSINTLRQYFAKVNCVFYPV